MGDIERATIQLGVSGQRRLGQSIQLVAERRAFRASATSCTVRRDHGRYSRLRYGCEDALYRLRWRPSTFNVVDGATVTLAAGSAIRMLGHFDYVDGTVSVHDASFIDKGDVTANQDFGPGANVVVDGPKAVMVGTSSDIGAGALLTIRNGGSFSSGSETIDGIVKVDGRTSILGGDLSLGKGSVIELRNGIVGGSNFYDVLNGGTDVVASGGLHTVARGALVFGNGTIYPDNQPGGPPLSSDTITNDGVIVASGGTLKILGSVEGDGALAINARATLNLGGNSSEDVVFLNHATLMIDKGAHETGFLEGFEFGDKVDLADQAVTAVTTTHTGFDTIVDLYDGSAMSDQLSFLGQLRPSDLAVAKDGSGGTTLTLDSHLCHGWIPGC
jgi:hypothetical protein